MDSLIFNEFYPIVDHHMSDSNIGGRKKRMAKDHLFIVLGIMNEVVNGDDDPIDIQVYDLEKVFDKLWLEECMDDMIDVIPEEKANDKLSLLFESNKLTKVAVKTPFGLTNREDIEDIVQQGGQFGTTLCSNSVDKLG